MERCLEAGIDTATWTSETRETQYSSIEKDLQSGEPTLKLLYTTPESLRSPRLVQALQAQPITSRSDSLHKTRLFPEILLAKSADACRLPMSMESCSPLLWMRATAFRNGDTISGKNTHIKLPLVRTAVWCKIAEPKCLAGRPICSWEC